MMEIRPTELKDLPLVMEIYDYARAFMRANGNATQWIDGYPSESFIRQEIEDGHSYVCTDEQGEILGTFCFILGEDPTYLNIYEGAWLNDEPYGVIHRMAASGKRKGVSEACLNWCFEHFENIRVDTHRDNKVMQHILTKYGFQRCGIIYVKNGTERMLTKEYFNCTLPFSRSLFIDKLLVHINQASVSYGASVGFLGGNVVY